MANPSPQEAELMPPLELHTILLRSNFEQRNTTDSYWRRLHRHYARQAVQELRRLTNRQRKE